jgi:hypothetical protein
LAADFVAAAVRFAGTAFLALAVRPAFLSVADLPVDRRPAERFVEAA